MNRIIAVLLPSVVLLTGKAVPQIVLSGQTAAEFFKAARTQSPRSLINGRPSFGWSTYLFLDAALSDNVAALSTVRVTDDEYINFDFLAVRLTNLLPLGLNLEAGKFDLPFGNLGERRYPRRNPLFSLPVIYEYPTSLPQYLTTESEILGWRGHGGGMPLLDHGLYDIGAMLYGSWGALDYALAVTNGSVSATYEGAENANSDFGKIARLAVTVTTGLTIGGAYAWGGYLQEPQTAPPRGIDVNTYVERAAEIDLNFSRGHGEFNAEAVFGTWKVPLESGDRDFHAYGYYAEGKYTLIPRLYVAARLSALRFNTVLLGGIEQPWDYNVTEWEGGFGYFLERDVLVKLVRRETRTFGGTFPKDNLTVLQLAVAY